jgi:hypothetical protein
MIKSYLRGEQTNWDVNLGCLAGAYRATPNESTGLTPNLLLFGREIRMPYEIVKEGISYFLLDSWGLFGFFLFQEVHITLEKLHSHNFCPDLNV